jgi:predicted dehydrogenase
LARLRVGVAGCGAVAQIMHLAHLRELDQLYELVAIADADAETLALVGDHYGVAGRHGSFDELLEAPIDAVLILTPGSHGGQCVAAARAGKHIFVEKPLCYTLRECDAVAEAVERAGVTLQVGYMKRYDPAYRRARELVTRIEDLRYGQITTIHPSSNLFFAHHPIRRRRGEPPARAYRTLPYPIPPDDPVRVDGEESQLLRGVLGRDASVDQLVAFKVMLSSLCHDVNALRGLLGQPSELLGCEVWQQGGCVSALLGYGDALRVHYAFVYVPDLRDYREELAFYGASERVRIVFPSPFLRNTPTELFHQRSEDGAAVEARLVVGYEEAFMEELRAFHESVVRGTHPLTDVADSRGDLVVLTDMARLMSS